MTRLLYKVYRQQPAQPVYSGTGSTDWALWHLSVILAEIAESVAVAAETAQSEENRNAKKKEPQGEASSRNAPTGSRERSAECLK